jgi:hypothetical protein
MKTPQKNWAATAAAQGTSGAGTIRKASKHNAPLTWLAVGPGKSGKLATQRTLAWLPGTRGKSLRPGVVITLSEIGPLLKKMESARFVRLIELSGRNFDRFCPPFYPKRRSPSRRGLQSSLQ